MAEIQTPLQWQLRGSVFQLQLRVSVLAVVLFFVLRRLGLREIHPFYLNMLGKLGERQLYFAVLHHKSAIYATILSPSNIFDDWLNVTPKQKPNVYWLFFAPLLVGFVYWLSGWNAAVIWVAGISLALLALVIIANVMDWGGRSGEIRSSKPPEKP